MSEQANNPHLWGKKEKLSADEAGRMFSDSFEPEYRRLAHQCWNEGHCFGHNEAMEKFSLYIACQPPAPIVMDKNKVSLETYKMFVREKIKRDSKGSWWAKIKLWYKFIKS